MNAARQDSGPAAATPDWISSDGLVQLYCGDARQIVPTLAPGSVDAVVTDPPYGLRFMGRRWDYDVPEIGLWERVREACKPGAALLAFSGSRTQHRMVCRIEDAGWEIRDCLMWLYGSGFPKSHDVSKAIDREAGAEREVVRIVERSDKRGGNYHGASESRPPIDYAVTAPATDAAREWDGWGTALKPAYEPICLARNPLQGTVAQNVLQWVTGALHIDACRIEAAAGDRTDRIGGHASKWGTHTFAQDAYSRNVRGSDSPAHDLGRWPANVCHDGSDEVLAGMPQNAGAFAPVRGTEPSAASTGHVTGVRQRVGTVHHGDSGSAARFFYCAKATPAERGEGNTHPTVKPIALMAWLVRLVCRRGGVVLDPFAGSGTTALAAWEEGCRCVLIEREPAHCEIIRRRIEARIAEQGLFAGIGGKEVKVDR